MKLIRRIFEIIPILLIIAAIAGYFLLPSWKHWCDRQYHKIKGVYYVYQGDKAYARSKQKDANIGFELNSAVKNYNLGLKEYPEHYQARCNLANIYVTFEDFTSAVEQYELALKYKPNYIECRMDLGILEAEELSEYDEAIAQYAKITEDKRKSIKIPFVYNNADSTNENKMNAYYNTGLAYRGKTYFVPRERLKYNQYLKEAVKAYSSANKLYKKHFKGSKEVNNYDILYNLALTHHLLGDTKQAGLNYCKAIEADPTKYEAHLNLAILLDRLKYHKEAINEYTKAGLLVDEGDYETLVYLNNLLNDSYRKNAILEEQQYIIHQMEIEQPKKETWFEKIFKPKNTNKDNNKTDQIIDNDSQNVIFKNGKAVIKEESEAVFHRRIKKCESKKLFEEMP